MFLLLGFVFLILSDFSVFLPVLICPLFLCFVGSLSLTVSFVVGPDFCIIIVY